MKNREPDTLPKPLRGRIRRGRLVELGARTPRLQMQCKYIGFLKDPLRVGSPFRGKPNTVLGGWEGLFLGVKEGLKSLP